MEAILSPILTALALALVFGILAAVLAKILKSAQEEPVQDPGNAKAVIRPVISADEEDFTYEGPASCRARALFFTDGNKAFFCPGYGDCMKACPEGAITITDNVPSVNTALCTGCGRCKGECPASFIRIEEDN